MLEILLYPIITGIMGGIATVIFEYYFVQPIKERQKSIFNISQPLAFFLSVCAGVMLIEVIIHFLFPNIKDSKQPILKFLSNANIAFAASFYIVFTSVIMFWGTINKFSRIVFLHLIPFIVFGFWVLSFVKPHSENVRVGYEDISIATRDFSPSMICILFMWLFSGFRILFERNVSIILGFIFFPIIAILINLKLQTFDSWALSFVTCLFMCLSAEAYIEFFNELKKEKSKNRI